MKFRDYLIYQIQKSAVDVKLGTPADPTMLRTEGYDEVVVAIGSEPLYPPIPGVRGDERHPRCGHGGQGTGHGP